MTLGAVIAARLTGYSGVSALVGTRIYPLELPQKPTYPAIRYQRISNTDTNGNTALRETRWQIDCWGQTYAAATALAAQVKAAFEGFTDTNQTPGIKQSYVVNEGDDYDDQAKVFRTIVEVILVTTGD